MRQMFWSLIVTLIEVGDKKKTLINVEVEAAFCRD